MLVMYILPLSMGQFAKVPARYLMPCDVCGCLFIVSLLHPVCPPVPSTMPTMPVPDDCLPPSHDPEHVLQFCRQLRPACAGGPDGWSANEWKRMDLYTAGYLALLFDACAAHGRWPAILACAHTVFIPKGVAHDIPEIAKLRPISITCFAYRTWAWLVLRSVTADSPACAHPNQYGGVPGRSATDM